MLYRSVISEQLKLVGADLMLTILHATEYSVSYSYMEVKLLVITKHEGHRTNKPN